MLQSPHRVRPIKSEPIRFLADVNIEKGIVDYLLTNGYNIKWIPDFDCRMSDEELLALSNDEKRILITNDKDFGELSFRQKRFSTGIILFRVKDQKSQGKVRLIQKLLLNHRDKLRGHFTVVTRKRIRIIPMEDLIT